MKEVLGWDIGGVNTKAARATGTRVLTARAVPYEIQRDPAALAPLLHRLGRELGARPGDPHGVTMTAELSQLFRTKRDGVAFVLDAVTQAFPDGWVRVYAVDGGWRTADEARRDPLAVAAANWAATARLVCGDRDMLDEAAVDAIAAALWDAQVARIAAAVGQARRRHPALTLAVVTGLGDFLAAEAARRAALRVTHLAAALGPAARHAPAAAVALLLATELATKPVPA